MIDGKSSLKPVAPVPPENSLLLYNFDLRAYTKLPKAIGVEDFKYRRYTMRDIGDLEKRIHNLEYYTSLNETGILTQTPIRFPCCLAGIHLDCLTALKAALSRDSNTPFTK